MITTSDPNRLYWNVSGHVTCGEHTPYVGSDTWEWENWSEVPHDVLAAWRAENGKPFELMECEVCGKHDERERVSD